MPIGAEVIYRHLIADENGIVGSITPLATPSIDATPFSKWKVDNARNAVLDKVSPIHYRAQAMYDGDHWQSGWGWIGPHPDPINDEMSEVQSAWKEIGAGFVSRNVVREIARRFRRAAMGREPRWALVPRDMSVLEDVAPAPEPPKIAPATDERGNSNGSRPDRRRALRSERNVTKRATKKKIPVELQKLIDEASRSLTLWWDERGLHEMLQKVITTLQMPSGRACVRIYVPDGLRRVRPASAPNARAKRTLDASTSLDDALAKLFPEHPLPTHSVVHEDAKTKRKVGVVFYRVSDEQNTAGRELVELTYLDDSGKQTLVRTIDNDRSSTAVPLELGGKLLTYEATMEPIITEQMIELQRALNLALTMLPRNITTSGFLNRIIANGMLPGHWEVVDGKRTGKYIVTDLPTFGAGFTNYITGQEQKNKDGSTSLATVGVHETPPVDPTPTLRGVRGLYETMLEEGEQGHVLDRSADNANSGNSKEQGRAGFESASDEIATRVNRLGRWLLETSLAAAEVLMGAPGKYTGKLRVVFECRTRIGPVSNEERTSWMTAGEKGFVAIDTVREAIGVYDTDAEQDKIDAQEGGQIDLRIRQANAFKMFIDSKLHGELAGELVGFSEELLAKIGASFDETIEREEQQKEAELQNAQAIAQTSATAKQGQGAGGGRPTGNKAPPPRQGQSKTTQKQSAKNRKAPTP